MLPPNKFPQLKKQLPEYQGFDGTNFEEDNAARKLAGGGVFGFDSEENAPANPETIAKNDIVRSQIQNIGNVFQKQPEKLSKLDQIRNNIMRLQQEQDLVDDEAQRDPRFAEDFANGTTNYEKEYFEKYPDAASRLEQLRQLQKEYQRDANSKQHLKFRSLAEKLNR